MKDYVGTFQDKIAAINVDTRQINIINAGVMNHGKSSLFNCLLDKNIFPEEDIRTTVEIQSEQWCDNVWLIDTPGLDAEEVDDAVAYSAYRRANVILFVHRVDVGELHRKGLEGINKIKSLFPDEKYFKEHFCLVLTSIDEQNARENLNVIRGKIRADVQNFCGLNGFKIFCVSNTRYKQGKEEGEEFFIKESGIPKLREYLQQNFSKWLGENKKVRATRITREKEDLISQLRQERDKIQSRIQTKTEQIQQRQRNFLHKLEEAVSLYNADKAQYEYQDSVLENLNNEFVSLTKRWNSERY